MTNPFVTGNPATAAPLSDLRSQGVAEMLVVALKDGDKAAKQVVEELLHSACSLMVELLSKRRGNETTEGAVEGIIGSLWLASLTTEQAKAIGEIRRKYESKV